MPSVSSRSANCDAKLLLYIALGIELLEVSPNILGLLFILDSGKYHFGAWNSRSRIFDVFLKRLFVPCDARILIGIGVAVIRRTSGVAAVEAAVRVRYRSSRPVRSCDKASIA